MDVQRFEILPLLEGIKINDKLPIKITCIEVYNDDVYIGTIDSFIFRFQNGATPGLDPRPPPLCKYLGLKKPIIQLKVASILDRLLCVCDTTLFAFHLDSLEFISSFKVRNVFGFCFNENPIQMDPFTVEMCLMKRKSLCIGHVQADKITVVKELNVAEQPILLAMDGHFICMASASNYYMVNWETLSSQLLCSHDADSFVRPICKFVTRNEFLINGLSHLGVFSKTSGISERPPIDWGEDVEQIAYSYPYILCLKKNSISIISVIDQKLKDEFVFENGVCIDNFDGKIVVSTTDSVFWLRKVPWEEQIDSLINSGRSQEAIDLCFSLYESGLISNADIDYAKMVKRKAGLVELKRENYEAAKQYLLECDCNLNALLSCFEDITRYLDLKVKPGEIEDQELFEELRANILTNSVQYNRFMVDFLTELLREKSILYTSNVTLVQTALLFLYFNDISQNYGLIEQLFDSERSYDFDLVQSYLYKNNLYQLLVLLYSTFPEHYDKALDLLMKLEKDSISDSHYKGLGSFVKILNNCKDGQMIMNYIEFILERDQDQAVKVLKNNTVAIDGQFTLLDPEKTIKTLNKYRKALVSYLDYLVFDLQLTSAHIHTNLALLYIEIISIQRECEESDSESYAATVEKLKNLLKSSDYYDKETVLNGLIRNRLDYETAYLYGKIGEHRKAFEIYLVNYLDYDQALHQCLHYGGVESGHKIYDTLLDVYLELYQKNGPEVMKPLLDFLNHSQCNVNFLETLHKLPADWSLDLVNRCLRNHLSTTFNRHFQSSFSVVLTQSTLERHKEKKQRLSQKLITIDRNSVCLLCNTSLMDSKFVWIPSMDCVIHDYCYQSAAR